MAGTLRHMSRSIHIRKVFLWSLDRDDAGVWSRCAIKAWTSALPGADWPGSQGSPHSLGSAGGGWSVTRGRGSPIAAQDQLRTPA